MSENLSDEKLLKCYKHTETDAVGACLSCGKSLCEICGEWFKGRFYCVSCYATVEIMHAQAESPQFQNLKGSQAPGNIIALIFASFCSILVGFLLIYLHKNLYGIVLLVFGWTMQGFSIPLLHSNNTLSKGVKQFLIIFLYISLIAVFIITILFFVLKTIKL